VLGTLSALACNRDDLGPSDASAGEDADLGAAPVDANGVGDALAPDGGGPTAGPRLYVALAAYFGSSIGLFANELVLIDINGGRAITDASVNGVAAIAYRNGILMTARGSGYTRISMLDRDTLAVIGQQPLPWDPDQALFTADGQYMYAGHGDGVVSRVRVADGQVVGEVQMAGAVGGAPALVTGLALDPTGSRLIATVFDGDIDNSVAVISISGDALSVTRRWVPPPFSDSNCSREAAAPAFDLAGSNFATFDSNCGAFEIYTADTGTPTAAGPVRFPRPDGGSAFVGTVADALGQFWAADDISIYWTSGTGTGPQGLLPFGMQTNPVAGLLVLDPNATTIYAVTADPRSNGIFTVDTATGEETPQAWNLDLVPFGATPRALELVAP